MRYAFKYFVYNYFVFSNYNGLSLSVQYWHFNTKVFCYTLPIAKTSPAKFTLNSCLLHSILTSANLSSKCERFLFFTFCSHQRNHSNGSRHQKMKKLKVQWFPAQISVRGYYTARSRGYTGNQACTCPSCIVTRERCIRCWPALQSL